MGETTTREHKRRLAEPIDNVRPLPSLRHELPARSARTVLGVPVSPNMLGRDWGSQYMGARGAWVVELTAWAGGGFTAELAFGAPCTLKIGARASTPEEADRELRRLITEAHPTIGAMFFGGES